MAPSIDRDGFWGKTTSTLDWCEENYVMTPYIAEFWNTITNVMMIIPPAVCAVYYWKKGLEFRHILSNLALLAVGVGSWCFHMTLLYEMQLLDELPMIYGTCVFLFTLNHHAYQKNYWDYRYVVCLVFSSILITVVYLFWQNPLFHQACYGSMVFVLMYEALQAIKTQPKIFPCVLASLITYGSGFILWNIDNQLCSSLRHARNEKLHPAFAPVTQLHGWWHILTGMGTYLHILFSSYARTLHLKRECSIKMLGGVWPYLQIGDKE